MRIDADMQWRIAFVLDFYGWEQDGNKPCFVNVRGNVERRTFKNWNEAYNFAVSLRPPKGNL